MSNTGVFIVGFLITLVVFVALGTLAYGIALERRDLDAEKLERAKLADSPTSEEGTAVPLGSAAVGAAATRDLAEAGTAISTAV